MGRWLTDLADVMRTTGYPVTEVDGWQQRSRGGAGGRQTNGYQSGAPNHVMVHHTASGPSSDGWPDVNYCTFNDDDAPLCNLYLGRTGEIWVCAAAATNCNGSGEDPCGLIGDDTMNANAIAIEAGNNGTGETWPDAQLDSYVALCAALCAAYDIDNHRIHAHFEWCPGRKFDPAGPDRYAGGGADLWDMDAFRADCGGAPSRGDDDLTPEEHDMLANINHVASLEPEWQRNLEARLDAIDKRLAGLESNAR